jgi:HEAT repeat protein
VGEKIEVPAYLTKLEQAANGEAVDSAILTSAITLAGEDPLSKEAGKYLIDILKSTENLGVANACLMALAQRKDPSALQAIIDFSEGKPALIRRQAILAVRQIPSQLSKEWLVVMAYGHSDPQVRKEALEALNNLEKQPRENK